MPGPLPRKGTPLGSGAVSKKENALLISTALAFSKNQNIIEGIRYHTVAATVWYQILFLDARRISGEWVEYDTALKGWKLRVGESVLWGDV